MSSPRLVETLDRLCNLLRSDARQRALPHGLRPVQVEALLYLARCNRYSDTPRAVAEFLGSTKGTVSQTLNVLEREGLVTKTQDPDDRRKVHLGLTTAGRALAHELAVAPMLARALDDPRLATDRLADDLLTLLAGMQKAAGYRSFGICHTCRFFRRENEGFRCGLTGERLSTTDSTRICREHERPERSQAAAPTGS